MPFRKSVLLFAIVALLPSPARAQFDECTILLRRQAQVGVIECPDVDFATDVGSRRITLRWDDPPRESQTKVDLSLRKVRNFFPNGDSLAWRGTALPSISGQYTGLGDLCYKFTADLTIRNFTTVDTARVAAPWTGSSLPRSGGTFRSCVQESAFVFRVTQGGLIGDDGGTAVTLEWDQAPARSGTINIPASYQAGTLIEVFAGLAIGFTPGSVMSGDSFTVATLVPPPADIRFFRDAPGLMDTTFSGRVQICRPDTAVHVENGIFLALGPGSIFDIGEQADSLGVFFVTAQRFDGFRVLRSDISNLSSDSMVVLREFYLGRAADSAFFQGDSRVYHDIEVHNGFPYEYAVTCFDTLSGTESAIRRSDRLYPRTEPGSSPADIQVIPNPYKRRVAWEERGESKVQFVNVPTGTSIRIYTASGSLVRVITPDEVSLGCGASSLAGCVNWDLRNGGGREIVSGIYIFHADSPGLGSHVGKFMVAR